MLANPDDDSTRPIEYYKLAFDISCSIYKTLLNMIYKIWIDGQAALKPLLPELTDESLYDIIIWQIMQNFPQVGFYVLNEHSNDSYFAF